MADTVPISSGTLTYLDIDSTGSGFSILVTDQGGGDYSIAVDNIVASVIPGGGTNQLDFSQGANSQYILLIF